MLQKKCCTKYWPNLSNNQWPIILGGGLYTTFRGERVLVVIRFDAAFLSWGLIVQNIYQYHFLERCRNSNNVWLRALMQSDCLYSSLFFEHYNRILLCDWVLGRCSVFSFEGVCMPQYFRTLPGLDQDWTQCPTLDVVLYQVLRISEQ